ncbi:bacteriophytochrome (light-regulated signal transduction histidine kinase) [Desulfitobacterium dehalogenans ATCC 51507]|uniref:histidine kinase n=1 Tax=Desulfitobacterium dehalogenans (strain ATCC 51507 / DSM 9161 / JW/IU-DC1) TaxID=756499 RepID=I4A4D1_DESDJ|nr:ATP-binding protein [Desulfitobacterium dehalogenans]AFL98815.1 bacteriophytochrome (light-regulated signal transduction histidine kinase) [Desulfitobacterium dehalogenans ATCC 51507]
MSQRYRTFISILFGLISFVGVFFASRFDFNGFSINITWSLMLPLLVALAWGTKYGVISVVASPIIFYPFILGSYNGWASLIPSLSLLLWVLIHGYGSEKRQKSKKRVYNLYFLQLIYVLIRFVVYITLFPILIRFNEVITPFWNPQAYTEIDMGIILLFVIKGIIVESILLGFCDAVLLLPFVRKFFNLPISSGARYNTYILSAIVLFGLCFTLAVLGIYNYISDEIPFFSWNLNPSEETRVTFLFAIILFFIMGGITIRFVQRVVETQAQLRIRERQLEEALGDIRVLNDELEQRILLRTGELQNAVSELEGFAYTISHDLRAPIRAIEGYSNFILEDYGKQLNPETNEMLGSIKGICQDMITLIHRLLEYSITSKQELALQPVNLADLILNIYEELKVAHPDRNVDLVIENELPMVTGDKVLLRQALENILSNGFKFTKGRQQAILNVNSVKHAEEWVFCFKDNGVGFDMKYAGKLFHVFQRMHRKQDFEGTGIGLATVKKILEKHRGRVWIEGRVNEGAQLYFALPLEKNNIDEGENV